MLRGAAAVRGQRGLWVSLWGSPPFIWEQFPCVHWQGQCRRGRLPGVGGQRGEDQTHRSLLGFFSLQGQAVPPPGRAAASLSLRDPGAGGVVVVPAALRQVLHAFCQASPSSREGQRPILEH